MANDTAIQCEEDQYCECDACVDERDATADAEAEAQRERDALDDYWRGEHRTHGGVL